MNYQETLNYLYNSAPLFQHIGKAAYKEGLSNTYALDDHFRPLAKIECYIAVMEGIM